MSTPELTPSEHAQEGRRALAAYQEATGNDPDFETLGTDLIADVLHFMHRQGYDYAKIMRRAASHVEAELEEHHSNGK